MRLFVQQRRGGKALYAGISAAGGMGYTYGDSAVSEREWKIGRSDAKSVCGGDDNLSSSLLSARKERRDIGKDETRSFKAIDLQM